MTPTTPKPPTVTEAINPEWYYIDAFRLMQRGGNDVQRAKRIAEYVAREVHDALAADEQNAFTAGEATGDDNGDKRRENPAEAPTTTVTEAMAEAAIQCLRNVLEGHSEYDSRMCCDGRECGCQGSSVFQALQHYFDVNIKRFLQESLAADAPEGEVVAPPITDSASEGDAVAGAINHPVIVEAIKGYGGRCRDCADCAGICCNSGLPCDPVVAEEAINSIIHAIRFYTSNPHYLDEIGSALAAQEGGA